MKLCKIIHKNLTYPQPASLDKEMSKNCTMFDENGFSHVKQKRRLNKNVIFFVVLHVREDFKLSRRNKQQIAVFINLLTIEKEDRVGRDKKVPFCIGIAVKRVVGVELHQNTNHANMQSIPTRKRK